MYLEKCQLFTYWALEFFSFCNHARQAGQRIDPRPEKFGSLVEVTQLLATDLRLHPHTVPSTVLILACHCLLLQLKLPLMLSVLGLLRQHYFILHPGNCGQYKSKLKISSHFTLLALTPSPK